jgi:hypothetical protein
MRRLGGHASRLGRRAIRQIDTVAGVDLRPPLRRLRRLARRTTEPWTRRSLNGQLDGIDRRIADLERGRPAQARELRALRADVQELRWLGGRASELVDLVTELLLLAAQRDDPEFTRLVDEYLQGV